MADDHVLKPDDSYISVDRRFKPKSAMEAAFEKAQEQQTPKTTEEVIEDGEIGPQ